MIRSFRSQEAEALYQELKAKNLLDRAALSTLMTGTESRLQLDQVWRTAHGQRGVRVRASLTDRSHLVVAVEED